MAITLHPTVKKYRFLLGGAAIFSLMLFLFTSPPSQVTDSLEKAKSSIQQATSSFDSQDYPPKPNGDQPVGNSPQYADDINAAAKPTKSPSRFDDDSKIDENGQNPKAQDKDTPIKEAPTPNRGGSGNKNGVTAIKDKSKAYEGVPDKDVDSGAESLDISDDNSNRPNKPSEPKTVADCTKEPEYVVMVDAGSTGSRVHIYEFDVCYSPPKLNNEVFKMLKPGLSSFDTDAVGAAKSLDPLLDLALESVPVKKQGCTPIAVKATAGLRLLGEEKSNKILKQVREHLEKDYPFAVVDKKGVEIMSGDDEGVYAWIHQLFIR
jgi:guanosine-diphosphatase